MTQTLLLGEDARVALLAELAASGLTRDRTITTHKPKYPPARILSSQCEGVEPFLLPAYVRCIRKPESA